jgi:predicted NUDIX family NTP pyrophosphohydrolase
MARVHSAGVVLYRQRDGGVEVLLVHPGGPFWARKDAGAWSIPKGEIGDGEMPEAAARREFHEETGASLSAPLVALPPVAQSRAKTVHPFAAASDFDPASLRSATLSLAWPPGSGQTTSFPEIDRAEWFALDEARRRIVPGQRPILDALAATLDNRG